jgi:hypothetical protein
MRRFWSLILVLAAVLTLLGPAVQPTALYPDQPGLAHAATVNISPASSNYHILTFPLNRQYTATTAGVLRFKMPYPAILITVQATARASGGTSPTLTVDILETAVSVLSAPVSVTAGTVSEATITDANIADEAVVTANLAITGTSPTWDDITIVLVIARK